MSEKAKTISGEEYQKLVKNASNTAIFYGSYIDGIVCVEQIDMGSARTLNKY